jgi:hypothetical protein
MPRSALLLPLLLAGCVSASTIPPAQTEQQRIQITTGEGATFSLETTRDANIRSTRLEGTPAQLWPHLTQAYADLQLPVSMVDPATHRVGLLNVRGGRRLGTRRASAYVDCGSSIKGIYADIYDVYFSVVTQLVAVEGGTEARTRLEAYARDGAHSNNALNCTTKGELEKAIVARVQERTGGSRQP